MKGVGFILAASLLLMQGCTTDVVDFKLKGASGKDMAPKDLKPPAPSACEMVESFLERCKYCILPGDDGPTRGKCYKLGCLPIDAYSECKSCWWSDTPDKECFICTNKDKVIYKNTCSSKSSKTDYGKSKSKDLGS